jgi:hypothetical protein
MLAMDKHPSLILFLFIADHQDTGAELSAEGQVSPEHREHRRHQGLRLELPGIQENVRHRQQTRRTGDSAIKLFLSVRDGRDNS